MSTNQRANQATKRLIREPAERLIKQANQVLERCLTVKELIELAERVPSFDSVVKRQKDKQETEQIITASIIFQQVLDSYYKLAQEELNNLQEKFAELREEYERLLQAIAKSANQPALIEKLNEVLDKLAAELKEMIKSLDKQMEQLTTQIQQHQAELKEVRHQIHQQKEALQGVINKHCQSEYQETITIGFTVAGGDSGQQNAIIEVPLQCKEADIKRCILESITSQTEDIDEPQLLKQATGKFVKKLYDDQIVGNPQFSEDNALTFEKFNAIIEADTKIADFCKINFQEVKDNGAMEETKAIQKSLNTMINKETVLVKTIEKEAMQLDGLKVIRAGLVNLLEDNQKLKDTLSNSNPDLKTLQQKTSTLSSAVEAVRESTKIPKPEGQPAQSHTDTPKPSK